MQNLPKKYPKRFFTLTFFKLTQKVAKFSGYVLSPRFFTTKSEEMLQGRYSNHLSQVSEQTPLPMCQNIWHTVVAQQKAVSWKLIFPIFLKVQKERFHSTFILASTSDLSDAKYGEWAWACTKQRQLLANFSNMAQVWLDVKINKTKRCPNLSKSCQIYPEVAPNVDTTVFQSSLKIDQIFSPILWENLSARTFKNRPIWSHWTRLKQMLQRQDYLMERSRELSFNANLMTLATYTYQPLMQIMLKRLFKVWACPGLFRPISLYLLTTLQSIMTFFGLWLWRSW